jgi:hypothetical protein
MKKNALAFSNKEKIYAIGGSSVVELSTHFHKFGGSNPGTAATKREKTAKKSFTVLAPAADFIKLFFA